MLELFAEVQMQSIRVSANAPVKRRSLCCWRLELKPRSLQAHPHGLFAQQALSLS